LPIREAPPPAVAVPPDFHPPTQSSRDPAREESDFGALLLEGDVAFQRNAYDKALSAYAKAYQLNPRDPSVRRKLVVVLTLLGRAMEAQQYRR
jgi:Flp pilus assembly protein TadD